MTFYDKIMKLCQKQGVSITKMATDIGFSSSASRNWKNIDVPRQSTAKKIADYFGIDVDYFYNDGESAPAPTRTDTPQVAFHGGFADLTPEEFEKVLQYCEFLKSQRK